VPLVDPAVGGFALENSNSAASLQKAFDVTGMSVAQVMAAHGFSNFTAKDLAGNVGTAPVGIAASSPAVAAAAGKSKDLIHRSKMLTKAWNPLPPASSP
jgi:hypothetical protein